MGSSFSNSYTRPYPSNLFKMKTICKYPSLASILAIIVYDLAFMTFFVGWEWSTREHQIDRTKQPLNMRMDLLNPYWLKLLVFDAELRPGVELDEAYKLMKAAELGMAEEIKECMKMRKVKKRIQAKSE